jgi:hypothetical protein
MDKQQIQKLKKLGINTDNTTIEIFQDLINVAIYLYEELEIKEEDRFKVELFRLKKPSN